MRYLLAVLSLAILVAFSGCANVEPAGQGQAPVIAEPTRERSEPNESCVQEPALVQAAEVSPDVPADEVEIRADAGPIEANLPPVQNEGTPDPNGPAVDGPNDVEAVPEIAEATQMHPSPSLPTSNFPPQTAFHDQYAGILATYVREDGLVDYGGLRRRRLDLKSVLTTLDDLDPNVYEGWSRQEKLAFWINAYNLKMLDIIARNYPIESSWWLRLTWSPSDIRHIEGIWTNYKFIVMDEEFTLAEVEQRFFRKTFDDPRLWLVLTYASQSGPPLRTRPYGGKGSRGSVERDPNRDASRLGTQAGKRGSGRTEDRLHGSTLPPESDLDRQLDEQVRRFLSGPQGLQIDRRNGVVRLSALFKPNWRGKEFVGRYGTDKKFKTHPPETRAVLSFITNYLPAEDVEFLEVENYSLEYLNFDWRLNDTDKGY